MWILDVKVYNLGCMLERRIRLLDKLPETFRHPLEQSKLVLATYNFNLQLQLVVDAGYTGNFLYFSKQTKLLSTAQFVWPLGRIRVWLLLLQCPCLVAFAAFANEICVLFQSSNIGTPLGSGLFGINF